MSSSVLPPSSSGTPPGISDVVSQDDLTRWAQIAGVLKYLTAPLDPPPAPSSGAPIAASTMASNFQNMYAGLASAGVDNAIAHKLAGEDSVVVGAIGSWVARIIQWCFLHAGTVLKVFLAVLDGFRKGVDPEVGLIAVQVLNEFLGTDFTQANLPMGLGTGDHLQRAQAIGALLYNQLESEFAPAGGTTLVPTTVPAQTFSGLAVNFGLASGIMGVIGGLMPIGHVEELRELGEEVAKNIGLGRLVRRALTPLIQILVAQPATWAINTKYLPTQFKEADLVNPFTATLLPQDQIFKAMNLLGYSNDKIQAFIQMHQKKLSVADVELLVRTQNWAQQDGLKYIESLGYPQELASTVMQVEQLRRFEAQVFKLIDELETEVKNGRITVDEFTQVLDSLPLFDTEKSIIVTIVNYKVKAHVSHAPHALSEGELVQGFEAGLLTATDLTDRWTKLGLSDQDQTVRMALILLRLSRLETLSKEKQDHYSQALLAWQEKTAGQKPGPLAPTKPVPPFPLS